MTLQIILNRLQKLHPKEIDLSLNRISYLLKKLDDPQNKIKAISVVGTNGKYSTIQACYSILKEANFKCNIYTSPHILKINERFVFNNEQLKDNELSGLLRHIEKVNNNEPITFFEILTASFLYQASKYRSNISLVEAGLFHRFDATNVFENNLASIITSISKDHLDWIPENERTIEKIIFEKTSSLLQSNIIVAKQSDEYTMSCIKKTISKNLSNKLFFGENYSYLISGNNFFYYKDKFGSLKLPMPNILGEFQLENISNAIATLRSLDIGINDEHILNGIEKINNLGRLQKIESGKLKDLVKDNTLIVDGSHNVNGSQVLNKYLETLNCRKHLVVGMMANKEHENYISYFKNISSVTTIDIPNQPNSISGKELKNKFKSFVNVQYQPSIIDAIKSVDLKKGDLLLITGSLYLAGEVLSLN